MASGLGSGSMKNIDSYGSTMGVLSIEGIGGIQAERMVIGVERGVALRWKSTGVEVEMT